MRREVLSDIRQLQSLLANHAKEGLPPADLQVIRRGKALEYFSRHYGKVFKSDGEPITVKEAPVGINLILDEDANRVQDPPPVNAEPITRQCWIPSWYATLWGVVRVPSWYATLWGLVRCWVSSWYPMLWGVVRVPSWYATLWGVVRC